MSLTAEGVPHLKVALTIIYLTAPCHQPSVNKLTNKKDVSVNGF